MKPKYIIQMMGKMGDFCVDYKSNFTTSLEAGRG